MATGRSGVVATPGSGGGGGGFAGSGGNTRGRGLGRLRRVGGTMADHQSGVQAVQHQAKANAGDGAHGYFILRKLIRVPSGSIMVMCSPSTVTCCDCEPPVGNVWSQCSVTTEPHSSV